MFDWTGLVSTVGGAATGVISAKEEAKSRAKSEALEAQRLFELAKIRAQAEATRAAIMPGAPSEVQGGTGLASGIPTWALVGVGAGLLLLVLVMRK